MPMPKRESCLSSFCWENLYSLIILFYSMCDSLWFISCCWPNLLSCEWMFMSVILHILCQAKRLLLVVALLHGRICLLGHFWSGHVVGDQIMKQTRTSLAVLLPIHWTLPVTKTGFSPQVDGEEIKLFHSSNEGGKYDEDNWSENLLGVFWNGN